MRKYYFIALVAIATLTIMDGCKKEDENAISMSVVSKGTSMKPGLNGKDYEVVDLGLSVLWATCNIGANSPEQKGNLYAWGETNSKEVFEWTNYKWCVEDEFNLTKYCMNKNNGYHELVDDKNVLDMDDDAAYTTMGTDWHIPTEQNFFELRRNTTAKWCKLNGVGGFLFTSTKPGYEDRSIFFPLVGMNDYGKTRFDKEYGYYWANTIYYDKQKYKYSTLEASVFWLEHLDVDNQTVMFRPRYVGLPIRPVRNKE